MSRSAEDLGYPAWVGAFAALVLWALGGLVIYGLVAFIVFDPNARNWGASARLSLIVLEGIWSMLVLHAATTE